KTLPKVLSEQEQAQAREAYDEQRAHATIDRQAMTERFIGYFADGFLWQKHLIAGIRVQGEKDWPTTAIGEARLIDQSALWEDVHAFIRRVVALEMPRIVTARDLANAKNVIEGLQGEVKSLPGLQSVRFEP